MAETAKIKIQYYRSQICTPVKHKLVVKGLVRRSLLQPRTKS